MATLIPHTHMNFHLLTPKEKEKFLVLSTLWATFASAFLLMVSVNF